MKLLHHLAVLLLVVVAAGCAAEGNAPPAVDTTGPAVGSAVAKGGELSAVATVRQWISARNADAPPRRRWAVDDARVTRQGSRSATVWVRVHVGPPGTTTGRLDLEFEVTTRGGGEARVTRIDAAS